MVKTEDEQNILLGSYQEEKNKYKKEQKDGNKKKTTIEIRTIDNEIYRPHYFIGNAAQ